MRNTTIFFWNPIAPDDKNEFVRVWVSGGRDYWCYCSIRTSDDVFGVLKLQRLSGEFLTEKKYDFAEIHWVPPRKTGANCFNLSQEWFSWRDPKFETYSFAWESKKTIKSSIRVFSLSKSQFRASNPVRAISRNWRLSLYPSCSMIWRFGSMSCFHIWNTSRNPLAGRMPLSNKTRFALIRVRCMKRS